MTQTAQGTKEEPGEKCKWKRYVYRGQESSKLAPWYAQVLLAEKKSPNAAQLCNELVVSPPPPLSEDAKYTKRNKPCLSTLYGTCPLIKEFSQSSERLL